MADRGVLLNSTIYRSARSVSIVRCRILHAVPCPTALLKYEVLKCPRV